MARGRDLIDDTRRRLPRSPGPRWAVVALGLVVAYGVLLVALDETPSTTGAAIGLVLAWVPATVAALAASRARRRVRGVRLTAAALGAFALGLTLNGLVFVATGTVPFPSVADVGFAGFYVLLSVALVRHMRHRVPRLGFVTVLDSAIALLAIAAVLSVRLEPALEASGDSTTMAVFLAYPFADLALVSGVLGLVTITPGVMRGWPWLVGGLAALAATDTAFALGPDTSAMPDSALQLGWGAGLALIAMWVVVVSRAAAPVPRESPYADGAESRRTAHAAALSAGIAAAGVLTVLVIGTWRELPVMSAALAALTTLGAAARTQMGFRFLATEARLRAQAHTDDLTGLPNRRELGEQAERVLASGSRRTHAVLMLDLDGFKSVNDTRGHSAGDALLIEVARRLRASVRLTDVVARVGGDEFAILMPDADLAVVQNVADRITEAMRESPIAGEVTVGTSIGVALHPEHGEDMASLMDAADAAMYVAKASRTHVVVAGSATP
ncbi:MAG: GGDEF domain-containing protein [Actinomycetales bacterium]|nr:GGDEF domain-containing protein [Actinomycetales bacterium]